MATDDTIDARDDGPSFGRLVVDGCCHAFAGALRKVRHVLTPRFRQRACSDRVVRALLLFPHGRGLRLTLWRSKYTFWYHLLFVLHAHT